MEEEEWGILSPMLEVSLSTIGGGSAVVIVVGDMRYGNVQKKKE
jgi:hypothetical protein